MSDRKTRRKTDKAIKHLMAYTGPNAEWEGRFEQVQRDLLNPLAEKLEVSVEEMQDFFLSGPYRPSTTSSRAAAASASIVNSPSVDQQ